MHGKNAALCQVRVEVAAASQCGHLLGGVDWTVGVADRVPRARRQVLRGQVAVEVAELVAEDREQHAVLDENGEVGSLLRCERMIVRTRLNSNVQSDLRDLIEVAQLCAGLVHGIRLNWPPREDLTLPANTRAAMASLFVQLS